MEVQMAKTDPIVGRYIHLTIQGVEYRVYYEECGSGIPILCQHGGAGDGLEWRHMLNDPEITAKYRVIVPDLPYHGKSLPPESIEWWKQEFKATKSFFMDFYLELVKELELDRPVFLGVAIGGPLGLNLGMDHPDKSRAIISSGGVLRGGSPAPDWFYHPDITNEFRRPFSYYFCSPYSPEKERRMVSWCAMQTAIGEKGDLNFFVDHDLTGKTDRFDTSRCAVYLLTGDYNPCGSLEDAQVLADLIKGSKYILMKNMSLLGMAENPPVFKSYLMPILNEIAGR